MGKFVFGKSRKHFPTMFSTLSKTQRVILATILLSSANAFNFITSKNLSFGKELTLQEL